MAGGPVVSGNEIVVVHVGGPPIEGQQVLLQALHSLANDDIDTIYGNIQIFRDLDVHFIEKIFEECIVTKLEKCYNEAMKLRNSEHNNYYSKKDILKYKLCFMLYLCMTHYKTPKEFRTNTEVSIEHHLFADIRNKANQFQALNLSRVTDIDEIIPHLTRI